MRVGSRFAGEISDIELVEGGVEVIGVESHEGAGYFVVADFRQCQELDCDRLVGVSGVAASLERQREV